MRIRHLAINFWSVHAAIRWVMSDASSNPEKVAPLQTLWSNRSMKYYDEKQMGGIRRTLENEVLKWPGVTSREMMGCLCYFRDNKFFAWLVTNGIVLTKLPAEEKAKLSKQVGGKPFEMSGKPSRLWEFPLKEQTSVKTILPFVRKSYEAAKVKD